MQRIMCSVSYGRCKEARILTAGYHIFSFRLSAQGQVLGTNFSMFFGTVVSVAVAGSPTVLGHYGNHLRPRVADRERPREWSRG